MTKQQHFGRFSPTFLSRSPRGRNWLTILIECRAVDGVDFRFRRRRRRYVFHPWQWGQERGICGESKHTLTHSHAELSTVTCASLGKKIGFLLPKLFPIDVQICQAFVLYFLFLFFPLFLLDSFGAGCWKKGTWFSGGKKKVFEFLLFSCNGSSRIYELHNQPASFSFYARRIYSNFLFALERT